MRVVNGIFLACLGLGFTGCASDDDGDGFAGKDCDDNNASINPDADEVCDGLDNNCDGRVDEGLILEFYADLDGDKYGDPAVTVSACTMPEGYVQEAGDCDDSSSDYHPGQVDDCENPTEDYNCDGSAGYDVDVDEDGIVACEDCDDSDASQATATEWVYDADGDGYGLAGNPSVTACAGSPDTEGYVDNTLDCNDLNAEINPDQVEVCNGLDDDCDSETDEDVKDTFYQDSDGDGFGSEDDVLACEAPDGYATNQDDCDDDAADVNPDAEEVCNDGIDNNCDGQSGQCSLDPEAADVVMWGVAASDEAGISISGGGDLNSDGYDDIVVGAKNESTASGGAGAAYVIYGGPEMPEEMSLEEADIILTGQNPNDKAGRVVKIVPDVNDDDSADLLVASPSADPAGEAAGKVYISFSGGVSGSLADADVMFRGRAGYNYAGLGLAGGDVNGDGFGDVLVGAPGNDVGGDNSGTVYVLYGPVSPGTIGAGSVNDYITGEDLGDDVGAAMAVIDHNADGIDDLVLGSSKNSEGGTDAGSVYVVHGPFSGALGLDMADAQYTGESAADKLGDSVSAAGDIDADGTDDFIVGAKFDDAAAPDAGAAYVVPGGADSDTFGSVDDYHIVKLTGEASEDQFGAHVVGNGDIDGEGGFDLMISAPFSGGTSDTGTVYVFYSPAAGTIEAVDADARFDGEDLSDQLGNSLAFAGDVDGGGNTALMIGASKKDTAGADAGGVYLMKALDL